ncbi:unnamed protein product [Effrenium voratum]|uniref:Beta-lactamase-related domain-containing protein n=1 Tax=Effrenium voratum TaxID=2562239 RepID=A0AA36HUR4_9DINO|nr:unnamed protein product [Effrenium voratum]CAJ1375160.1 unnamed protein product [Effrenium voratum]CAJ1414512.1 unnamed protein product [Effrenium voratum]
MLLINANKGKAALAAGVVFLTFLGVSRLSLAAALPRFRGRPALASRRCEWNDPEAHGLSSSKLAELAADFEKRYIRAGLLKGAVVAIVKSGKVIALWELGNYTSNTVFKLYSISKVFTAIAGLQLCEAERADGERVRESKMPSFPAKELGISLDTPISQIVPEWPMDLCDESGAKMPPLLLRHCLTHTGGFSKTLPTVHPVGSFRPVELERLRSQVCGATKAARNLKEAVELEGKHPHIFAPGQHFNYCGVGSQLVARAVEEATGMNIAEYMDKRIFKPAGMESTGFVLDEALSGNCVSTDYHPWVLPAVAAALPGRWNRMRLRLRGFLGQLCGCPLIDDIKPAGSAVVLPTKLWDRSLSLFHPDAGVIGTGSDFVKWLQVMSSGKLMGATGAKEVFSQFVLDSLSTPTTPELQAPFAFDASPSRRMFPVRGDLRGGRQRPFNSFPGQRFSLGACVVTDPGKVGLPRRAEGAWHWMGFASTYFFVNRREELSACFLTQLISHRTYPLLDELVKGVHESLL